MTWNRYFNISSLEFQKNDTFVPQRLPKYFHRKMSLEYNFDSSLQITKNAFMISGFDIGETKYKFTKYFYYFNLLWLYTDVLGEFFWLVGGIRTGKSLDELSLVAPCSTICLLSTAKLLPFFLNKQTFQEAVRKLKAIHPIVEKSDDVDRKIIIDSHTFLKSVINLFYGAAALVIVMFSSEPLMLMAYEHYYTGSWVLKLPFLIKYFFDAYANITVWTLVYIHQVWSTIIVCVNIFAADTLFYTFCTFLRMHFRILSHQFENIVTPSHEETMKNLRKCAKMHQNLIELVNLLEILYSKSTLLNIISSSVLLCLSGFNITVVKKTSAVVTFAPFLLMSLTQVFLLCFFGDLLMASSIQISTAVYSCRWFDASPAIRKSVLIILIRSQKPCKVTAANFADLNLSAFTTILSRSWSCFALLKTMYS